MSSASPALAHAPAAAATRPAPELTVVVPTFKERDNVPLLVEKLARALEGIDWEVVFVDDNSPDGTAAAARTIGASDARVRCVRRIGRRGLSGACIEGMLASQAKYVAVMDADLQHDETLLTAMLEKLRGGIDLAVASRYVAGGSAAGLAGRRPRAGKQALDRARAPPARRHAHRSDERLLHDAARPLRGAGAAALLAGLQDPARHRGDRPREPAHRRAAVCVRRAPAWREQARYARRARFRRADSRPSSPTTRCRSVSCCSASSA